MKKKKLINLLEKVAREGAMSADELHNSLQPLWKLYGLKSVEDNVKIAQKNIIKQT